MLEYLIYFVFLLSVASAAGGIVLSNRLRSRNKYDFLSTLMYFQVFIYTFGFYGIWGQVIISFFMKDYLSTETLIRISDISVLLGLPFIVFAWLMLIRFSRLITGKKSGNRFVIWFLSLNFAVIFTFGYVITKNPEIQSITLLKYYFISFNFIYSLIASINLYLWKQTRPDTIINGKQISAFLILIMVIQNLLLFYYTSETYVALGFIISFFAGNSFLPLYMSYGAVLPSERSASLKELTLDQFCIKFDISPREKDIITEICHGLSNKEIADKLFISLQTVKDHTHRIYSKTNVRSRVHLINLVREIITS